MTFLPIVERELRRVARKRTTYWLRSGAGFLATLAFFWIWIGELVQNIPGSGTRLFTLLNVGAFLYCLLAGALFTADCISEEKREGTLGLLFLTNLRGHDIVLGKLAGGTLGGFYALLAILPVLAVPIVLGGVTLEAVVRSCLALGNTLFVSVAAGLLVSTFCRRDRVAIGLTLLFLILLAVALPGLDRYQQGPGWAANPGWSILSPAMGLLTAQDRSAMGASQDMFSSVWWTQHAMGWIFIGLACLVVPSLVTERAQGNGWLTEWARRLADAADRRLSPPVRNIALIESAPYRWLAARGCLNPLVLWTLLAGAACLGAQVVLGSTSHSPSAAFAMLGVMLVLQGIVKTWMIVESVHRMAEDRRLGTLELLLGTRVTPEEIQRSQRRLFRQRMIAPAICALFGSLVVSAGLAHEPWTGIGQTSAFGWWFVSVIVMVVDIWSLETIGPWVGLSVLRSNRAVLVAAWQVLVVPWLVFVGLLLLFGLNWRAGFSLAHAWLIVCVFNNLGWWTIAIDGLQTHYQKLVTERFVTVPFLPPSAEREPVAPRGVAALLTPVPSR